MKNQSQQQQQQQYVYQSEPRAVDGRAKYREPGGTPSNIMFDARVVRQRQGASSKQARHHSRRQRQVKRPVTPEPVSGRMHMSVQTENYMEELTDRPPESDMSTQTEAALDRPLSPLFVPKPSGVSKATSIEDGELFDFDLEVEPILQVLVGKTLDQSLMEVLEEEELRQLENHRRQYEQKRNEAVVIAQRMEAAEQRRMDEKARRLRQAQERERHETEMKQKLVARTLAKEMMWNMQNDVMNELEEAGHFYDPVQKEVEDTFLPWLLSDVNGRLSRVSLAQQLVDDVAHAAVGRLVEHMHEVEHARAEERARLLREEQERLQREAEEAERKRKEAEERRKKEEEEDEEDDGDSEEEEEDDSE
eukprot:TRINITY_DN66418_c4_g3_i1.p1 TRINITY_DN66418_c4_g3~~TRINITY_DN66418_c4_g3_i1.p1  ORF type:complete len:377 (-),score=200.31 TRINITY_DN66418_c4_g3_i1:95-1183(-)